LVFTGGHHTSALAVAQALTSRGWSIVWFGHRHSQWGDSADSAEYREVLASGIPFYDLKAGKAYGISNPVRLLRIPWGFVQALVWLWRIRPRGIVSFGGYLAVPTVIAGRLLGIPAVTHEQTVVTGWANRAVAPLVKKIFLTWPQSAHQLPKSKAIVTGLPLRPDFPRPTHPTPAPRPTVYITGGKQGSHAINQTVFAAAPQILSQFRLIHQTGSSSLHQDAAQAAALAARYPQAYEWFDFDSRRGMSALSRANVVVSRAGAHTIYELALLGKPCVLIPLPLSSHAEQHHNARFLASQGLAIILDQSHLSPANLLASLQEAAKLDPHPINLPRDGLHKLVLAIEDAFL